MWEVRAVPDVLRVEDAVVGGQQPLDPPERVGQRGVPGPPRARAPEGHWGGPDLGDRHEELLEELAAARRLLLERLDGRQEGRRVPGPLPAGGDPVHVPDAVLERHRPPEVAPVEGLALAPCISPVARDA